MCSRVEARYCAAQDSMLLHVNAIPMQANFQNMNGSVESFKVIG